MSQWQQGLVEVCVAVTAVVTAITAIVVLVRRACGFLRRVGRVIDHVLGDESAGKPDLLTQVDRIGSLVERTATTVMDVSEQLGTATGRLGDLEREVACLADRVGSIEEMLGEHVRMPARQAHSGGYGPHRLTAGVAG